MTKFTISDSETADLVFTRERETKTDSIELTMMTGQSIQEPKSWESSTDLDRYFDVVLRIIDHLWECHDNDPGFISSPLTDKHQFLKWLWVEEIPHGESQWIKGFRVALKAAETGGAHECSSKAEHLL